MTETAQHTLGPLAPITTADRLDGVGGPDGLHICHLVHDSPANARLLAAAYTSYDKHCGAHAVECAETDLLGSLLEALQELLEPAEFGDMEQSPPGYWKDRIARARAVLSKAQPT